MSPAADAPALEIRALSKRFGETRALDGVSLTIERGEIHGLLGHNGSGKSTLIKVLCGYQNAESGAEVRLAGARVGLPVANAVLRRHGVRFVHQTLGLVQRLTVAENLWLERIAQGSLRHRARVGFGALCRDAEEVLAGWGLGLDPRARVEELPAVERANLAILRAMLPSGGDAPRHPRLLVLDEPTAFLPAEEKGQLYATVRQATRQGAAVLFVSHFLDEVLHLCDRVTVLRDGRVVLPGAPTASLTNRDLVQHIVGDDESVDPPVAAAGTAAAGSAHAPSGGANTVRVRDLSSGACEDLSLDLRPGEIVGLTGAIGSGADDVPAALFGLGARAGTLHLSGRTLDLRAATPRVCARAGVGLVPADRNQRGICLALSTTDNVTVTDLGRHRRLGLLRRRAMREEAGQLTARYQIRPGHPELPTSALSGGNAQKVLLAKWLRLKPRLLLLEEPTQGVDVGSRHQIERLIGEQAAAGTSVVLTSSDPEQLAALCHRVLVVTDGRVTRTLQGDSLSKQEITTACLTPAGAGEGA